jgi:hypothetical protein
MEARISGQRRTPWQVRGLEFARQQRIHNPPFLARVSFAVDSAQPVRRERRHSLRVAALAHPNEQVPDILVRSCGQLRTIHATNLKSNANDMSRCALRRDIVRRTIGWAGTLQGNCELSPPLRRSHGPTEFLPEHPLMPLYGSPVTLRIHERAGPIFFVHSVLRRMRRHPNIRAQGLLHTKSSFKVGHNPGILPIAGEGHHHRTHIGQQHVVVLPASLTVIE